jgi:hypothetical protein
MGKGSREYRKILGWYAKCVSGLPRKIREIGEPCALKGACTVRQGGGEKRAAPRNHLREYLSGRSRTGLSRCSYGSKCNGTSLAAYFTAGRAYASPKGAKLEDVSAQSWGEIWACDFLQVTDLFFHSLFAFFIIELKSRKVIHVGVTRSPTDAWTTQQLREATRMDKRRSISSVIMIASLGPVSLVLQ